MTKAKEIKKDIEKYKSLEILSESDGGKLLVNTVNKDLINSIEWLANNYKNASQSELVGYCASIQSNLAILRVLRNAKSNTSLAEDALRQELDNTEL